MSYNCNFEYIDSWWIFFGIELKKDRFNLFPLEYNFTMVKETNGEEIIYRFILQEALVKRLGPNAHAFTMEITPLAPPSVQLVPAKEYNGAPIGTSYDVRAYIGEGNFGKSIIRGLIIRRNDWWSINMFLSFFFLLLQRRFYRRNIDVFLQFVPTE